MNKKKETKHMKSLPVYKCTKEVRAFKIDDIYTIVNSTMKALCSIDRDLKVAVDEYYMEKHKPHVGGYYVLYKDGYESFSPAKPFEAGYVELESFNGTVNRMQTISSITDGELMDRVAFAMDRLKSSFMKDGMSRGEVDYTIEMALELVKRYNQFVYEHEGSAQEPKAEYKTKAKEAFKDRLIKEAIELGEKHDKLKQFIGSANFEKVTSTQQDLLKVQLSTMISYLGVLELRIKDLNIPIEKITK